MDRGEVPDYYEVIKNPMGKIFFFLIFLDLQTLENNLDKGLYNSKEKFVIDLKRIFSNAKIYNKQFTIYYKYAEGIESSIEDEIKLLKDD